MIPVVHLAGPTVSRLIIGGNPFSGFSHQGPGRDDEMLDYYTIDSIKETLRRAEAIRSIAKPCIGYKILGAGRVNAAEGLEYAFSHIKPTDAVNLGMYRGDNDAMVEENAAAAGRILRSS